MRSAAEQLGVDTSIAASLQATTKLVAVLIAQEMKYLLDWHNYVDTKVSAKLQAAAKALDQARKKDAVWSGFQQRGTAEESDVDTSIARFNDCF